MFLFLEVQRLIIMVGALALALLILSAKKSSQKYIDYDYAGDDWTGLCATDDKQSPIDIVENAVKTIVDDDDEWITTSVQLKIFRGQFAVFKGESSEKDEYWALSLNGDFGSIVFGNSTYSITNLHFHYPSEHYIEGTQYDAELHIYAEAEYNDPLIVCILMEEGEESLFVQDAIESIEEPREFNLTHFISGQLEEFFMYSGSLTTPTCDPAKIVVIDDLFELSSEQIEFFKSLYDDGDDYGGGGNVRSIQPLYDRTILYFEDVALTLVFGASLVTLGL
mmetsp:Transcript_29537/g.52790  ORF Transcript_29537/g.52790 Transcript_29537/m.52790 type:complete len:279 (-) Transcript_29537:20-856(-)